MIEVAIEHRLMHAETLAYLLHQLPIEKKIPGPVNIEWRSPKAKSHMAEIPAGRATLGLRQVHGDEFGWDNEMGDHVIEVGEFAIDSRNVTNRDFLRFIQAGGYENPTLWRRGGWTREGKKPIQPTGLREADGKFER